MRAFRSCLGIAAILVLAGVAAAHGGGPHVMGTVKSVADKSLVVTDGEGHDVTIAIDEKTKITEDGKAAAIADIRAGERIVVHTRKTQSGLVAVEAKLGGRAGAASPASGEHEPPHAAQPAK